MPEEYKSNRFDKADYIRGRYVGKRKSRRETLKPVARVKGWTLPESLILDREFCDLESKPRIGQSVIYRLEERFLCPRPYREFFTGSVFR